MGPLKAELVAQLQTHDNLRLEDQCRLWEQSHGATLNFTVCSIVEDLTAYAGWLLFPINLEKAWMFE